MTGTTPDPAANLKQQAAIKAAALVQDGMVVGLGTGSTAFFVVAELGRRVREEGLKICAIPTSEATDAQAREEGIPLTTFGAHPELDITIDGADEIEPNTLNLVKGRGGALLREKIVASAAKQLVIVADSSKYVDHLGMLCPVPVEVIPFGWENVAVRLSHLGAQVTPRKTRDGSFYLTDEKNLILDCVFGPIADPHTLGEAIHRIVGVVEHGLFIAMATQAITAGPDGIRVITPTVSDGVISTPTLDPSEPVTRVAPVPEPEAASKTVLPTQPVAEGIRKRLLVIMGVSGSGKTTIAEGLRNELGWPFQEGDDLHPAANVTKMAAGTALNDEDRWPWLERCHEWLSGREQAGTGGILTCSALKQSYRDALRKGGLDPVFIYLHTTHAVLVERLKNRKGHYMPPTLLPSQLETLEVPGLEERALTVAAEARPAETIAEILSCLKTV